MLVCSVRGFECARVRVCVCAIVKARSPYKHGAHSILPHLLRCQYVSDNQALRLLSHAFNF